MSEKALSTARLLIRVGIGVVIVVEVLLALGILLQGLDANPDAGFTEWTYRNFDRVMAPFEGIFEDGTAGDGDGVLDFSAMFAMGVWAVCFIPLGMALGWVDRRLDVVEVERQRAADAERQALLFGDAPAPTPKRSLLDRLRTRVAGRRSPPDTPPATPTEDS